LTTTIDTIDARLAELQAERDAITPYDQRPFSMTVRESHALDVRARALDRRIAQAREAMVMLATVTTDDVDSKWHADLQECRAVCAAELLEIKSPVRDPKVMGRVVNLRLSLKVIDRGPGVLTDTGYDLQTLRLGQLLIDRGYEPQGADPTANFAGTMPWYGSLDEVTKAIADRDARRQRAQSMLDDAVMDDAERAQLESEATELDAAANALVIKVSSDGRSLVAYRSRQAFIDDQPLTVDEMSPLERRAFERAAAAYRTS
jgi:hypothetical protein